MIRSMFIGAMTAVPFILIAPELPPWKVGAFVFIGIISGLIIFWKDNK